MNRISASEGTYKPEPKLDFDFLGLRLSYP